MQSIFRHKQQDFRHFQRAKGHRDLQHHKEENHHTRYLLKTKVDKKFENCALFIFTPNRILNKGNLVDQKIDMTV